TPTRRFKPRFSLPKLSRINFFFSCKIESSVWILHQDNPTELQCIKRVGFPPTRTSSYHARISFRQLSCFEETLDVVGPCLGPPLDEDGPRRELVEYAWTKALERALGHMKGHEVLDLHFDVVVERKLVFSREVVERAPDSGRRNVTSDCCSICLEGFSGEEPLGMPCSHIFHGSCIGKWLRNNPFCPICRSRFPLS
ncbi:hypothetical protein MIMGU_mgv1a023613mg, partial [Erythranthe guttata]